MRLGLGEVPSPLPGWLDAILDVAVGPVVTSAADLVRNAIHGGAETTAATEDPGAVGGDALDTTPGRAAGPRASGSQFAPDYPNNESVAPALWPWALGLAVVGGGVVLVVRALSKRRR